MRVATILAIVSGATALSIRAECPISVGSACAVVTTPVLIFQIPQGCKCEETCSGSVNIGPITAKVKVGA
ncbi:hypothetical protein IF1G_08053 [Cordyceps javanica]|uniref:Uncharacterized protein n=1 Tax=Cordyceps javanica TaxID=43265 RepID=A0A545UVI5_9HYPO|nr:hypothetical protein IF1G_08053 [Cordyceps javanica]TQW05182.1 hypothetical protein IF2G_07119 [Cordyceps javanica]